jgi:2-dehydropantoate 2-reductase
MMRVLVLGAGGVGGYLGARMIEAGIDASFLVRPERIAGLRESGLHLESPLGDWKGHPKFVNPAELAHDFDIIVLSCKAYDLCSALDAIEPAAGPGTTLVPLLNGVAHLEAVSQRFPQAAVWGGVAHIGVTADGPGRIRHLNRLNTFLTGGLDERPEPEWADDIAQRLSAGPVQFEVRENIHQDMWDKLVFLATLAGMTCLMRADIGTIVATAHGEEMILKLVSECSAIAEAEGFAPRPEAMAAYCQQLTDPDSKSTASMLRDLNAGGPTEAEHILGDLRRRAETHGIDAPLLSTCLTHVQAYEISRRG